MLPMTRTFRPTNVRRRHDWPADVERWFDELTGRPLSAWSRWMPAADLYETDEEFVLELELPGLGKEDVEVTVEKGILTVSGQRSTQTEEERGDRHTYHVRERSYDRFSRSFSLPHSVTHEQVDAQFENGMLTVRLPKAAEAKPRRIEVR